MSYARKAPGFRASRRVEVQQGAIRTLPYVIPEVSAEREKQLVHTREDVARVFQAAVAASEAQTPAMQRLEDALRESEEAYKRYQALRSKRVAD